MQVGELLFERRERLVSLHEPVVGLGVNLNPGNQFDLLWRFDEIVGCATGEEPGLDLGFFEG